MTFVRGGTERIGRSRGGAPRRSPRLLRAALPVALVLALFLQGTAQAATVQVSIVNLAFTPKAAKAKLGDTVNWTNNEDQPPRAHTATSDGFADGAGTSGVGLWYSGSIIARGGQYAFTFTFAGKFPYHCSIHPIMTGSISVGPKASPASGPAGTSFRIKVSMVTLTGTDFRILIQKSDRGGPFQSFTTLSNGTFAAWDSTGATPGTYRFRARLHRISTDMDSAFSPAVAVTVST